MTLYHLNVTVHLLAALFWLGGMFFLALVGAPVLRQLDDPGLRARLFGELGRRFRAAGWWAIGVLVATGVANLHFRGVLDADVLGDPAFWSGAWGRALAWKLGGVGAMILTSALHDFVFGPRAAAEGSGREHGGVGDEAGAVASGRGGPAAHDRARAIAGWLARLNALLGIVVVLAAVRLARGG